MFSSEEWLCSFWALGDLAGSKGREENHDLLITVFLVRTCQGLLSGR